MTSPYRRPVARAEHSAALSSTSAALPSWNCRGGDRAAVGGDQPALLAKAAFFHRLGVEVHLCGDVTI
jgi:hypothetical protein